MALSPKATRLAHLNMDYVTATGLAAKHGFSSGDTWVIHPGVSLCGRFNVDDPATEWPGFTESVFNADEAALDAAIADVEAELAALQPRIS